MFNSDSTLYLSVTNDSHLTLSRFAFPIRNFRPGLFLSTIIKSISCEQISILSLNDLFLTEIAFSTIFGALKTLEKANFKNLWLKNEGNEVSRRVRTISNIRNLNFICSDFKVVK
jgi:hypothetical protein